MCKNLAAVFVPVWLLVSPLFCHAATHHLDPQWKAVNRAIALDRTSTSAIVGLKLRHIGAVSDGEVVELLGRLEDRRSTVTKNWAMNVLGDDQIVSSPQQAMALYVAEQGNLPYSHLVKGYRTPEINEFMALVWGLEFHPPDYVDKAHIDPRYLSALGDVDLTTTVVREFREDLGSVYLENRPCRSVKGAGLALRIYLDHTGDADFCRLIWAKSHPGYKANLLGALRVTARDSPLAVVAAEITSDVIHSAPGRYNHEVIQNVALMFEKQSFQSAFDRLIIFDFFSDLGPLQKYAFNMRFAYLRNFRAPYYNTPAGKPPWADMVIENARRDSLLLRHFSSEKK